MRSNDDLDGAAGDHVFEGFLDLFEWTLQRILGKYLRPTFAPAAPERIRFRSLGPLKGACRVLLSALARAGQSSQAEAERAFALGAQRLGLALGDPLPHAGSQLGDLDRALDQIATATPQVKRVIVHAAADCVAADGKVTVDEAELLRATAVSLGCPMPPLLPGQQLIGTESA